jgi:hypothetical protein
MTQRIHLITSGGGGSCDVVMLLRRTNVRVVFSRCPWDFEPKLAGGGEVEHAHAG